MQKHVNIVDLVKGFPATLYKVQMQRNTAMMMVTNGKMMTPIGPDISAPGSEMLYQRRRSTRMATDRKRPKVRRPDAAKRPLQEIGAHRNRRRQE